MTPEIEPTQSRDATSMLPARAGRARTQDLLGAVLAGGEAEEQLELLLHAARRDLRARDVLAITPLGPERWAVELADGDDAPELLGAEISQRSPLGEALRAGDVHALERIAELGTAIRLPARTIDAIGLNDLPQLPCLVAVVDAGQQAVGALVVLRDAVPGTPVFTVADRERLDALASLTSLALRLPVLGSTEELDDERRRIARDLHDLAIQELFAVGMELEALTSALSTTGEPPSNNRIRSSVNISVEGIENAVAQIRQIVQSLRRERSEATLVERLRHEVGLATSGLGFVPTLRLPAHPADLDRELPPEIAEDVVAVVRECLANAARHAHASAVAVTVDVIDEGVDRVVQVNVSDNGRGIDPAVSRRSGLANMSSRARRHAGWVDAISLEPGTMISWRVTLPPVSSS